MTPRQFKIGVSFRIRTCQSVPPGSMMPRSLAPFRDGIAQSVAVERVRTDRAVPISRNDSRRVSDC